MFGLYLLALVLGYTIGFCTNWFYRWLLYASGRPYVERWAPQVIREEGAEYFVPAMRWMDDDAVTENDEEGRDGRVWVKEEKFAPSITWKGQVPPGTTFSVDEKGKDEEEDA